LLLNISYLSHVLVNVSWDMLIKICLDRFTYYVNIYVSQLEIS